jgi:hypothetical protein
MSVQQIEQEIAKLPREEFLRLREQIQRRFDEEWDAQFESDVKSGRLNKMAAAAVAEHRAGKSKPFPADAEALPC